MYWGGVGGQQGKDEVGAEGGGESAKEKHK